MSFTPETVRSSVDSSGGSATTQATAAFSLGAGRLAIVELTWEGNLGSSSIADTALNTFTPLTKASDANQQNAQLFYCLSTTAHATNVVTATLPAGSQFRSIAVRPYLPSGTASFVAAPANAAGISTTPLTAAFTAGDLAVALVKEFSGGITLTPTSPYASAFEDTSVAVHFINRTDSPGGTITAGGTLGGSTTWLITAASFADAVGGAVRRNSLGLMGAGR